MMKIATISQIKNELKELPPHTLMEICLTLAKYKKDNKELLNYLLFESINENDYINTIKSEMADDFSMINRNNMYFAKKTIRKIHRNVSKHIKYSGKKETQIELLICFCEYLRQLKIPISASKAMVNLYNRQINNIEKALISLDEDLQYDFKDAIDNLKMPLP